MEKPQCLSTRAALGSLAQIGDLYDSRRDAFLNINIFKEKPPPQYVVLSPTSPINLKYFDSDSMTKKLDELNIDSALKLSILGGITELKGSGEFLNHHSSSTRAAVKMALLYDVNTKHESIDISMAGVNEYVSLEKISSAFEATHVIVGINWGSRLVVEVEHQNEENADIEKLKRDLKTQLETVESYIYGEFNNQEEEWDLIDVTSERNMPVKIFGDIIMANKSSPQTMEDVYDLITEMPELLAKENEGKGIPIGYVMLPLNCLPDVITSKVEIHNHVQRVQDSTVLEISNVFDDLISIKQEVFNFYSDINNHQFCVQDEIIQLIYDLKEKVDIRHKEFTSKLAASLVEIRSGEKEENELKRVVKEFNNSSIWATDMRKHLCVLSQAREKIAMVNTFRNKYEVQYVDKNTSLISLVQQNSKGNLYLLYFDEKSRQDEPEVWHKTQQLFLDIVSEHKNSDVEELNAFYLVDCNILKHNITRTGIRICHYMYGKLITSDMLKYLEPKSKKSYAKSVEIKPYPQGKPFKRATVLLPCPGSLNSGFCVNENQHWLCFLCENPLEYGFNGNFYCSCGHAPCVSFKFKCNDVNHGMNFTSFNNMTLMESILSKLEPVKEINILLLGETGVGKTTWINSFANYLTYSSLDEAAKKGMISLVPSKFPLRYKGKKTIICTGSDKNESHINGQADTQFPVSHTFPTSSLPIRIIDTPGIGDPRGLEQDRQNLNNILDHLSGIPELNAICILFKPNESRLHPHFKYCITEFLINLHKGAAKNIIFCFTNSRETFYEPGETLDILQELLENIPQANIVLSEDTTYCFDNESFRFLAALKHGLVFDDVIKKSYEKSWDISVKETARMFNHIMLMAPHPVMNILSISNARCTILELTKPLAKITRTIHDNISRLSEKLLEIKSHKGTKEELMEKVYFLIGDLKALELNCPRTVCTRCSEHLVVDDVTKTNYNTICHDNCRLEGITESKIMCAQLQNCWALYETDGKKCKVCGCSWEVHMHISYEMYQIWKPVENVKVRKQIEETDKEIESVEKALETIKETKEQYETEAKVILEVCSTFATFLKANAIVPYNDCLIDYLDHVIKLEKGKVKIGRKNGMLQRLLLIKEQYIEEKKVLEEAISRADKENQPEALVITPKKVMELEEKLYNLPINGSTLKDIMDIARKARKANFEYKAKTYVPPGNYKKKCEQNIIQRTIGSVKSGLKDARDFFTLSNLTEM